MRQFLFLNNRLAKKSLTVTILSFGIIVWGGYNIQAVKADINSESTGETALSDKSTNSSIISAKDGTCDLTLDTNSGVLTIGPGQLKGAVYSEDTNNVSSMLEQQQSGASALVKSIKIEPGVEAPENSSFLFRGFDNLTNFDGLSNLNIDNTINVHGMFYGLESLTSIDISSWKSSNIEYASYMFQGDSNLESLTLGDIFRPQSGSNEAGTQMIFSGDTSLSKLIIPQGVSFYLSTYETDSYFNPALNKYYSESDDTVINDTGDDDGAVLTGPITVATAQSNQVFVNEYMTYKIDGIEQTRKISDHKVVDIDGTDEVDVPSIKGYKPDVQTITFNIPNYSGDELNKLQNVYYPDPSTSSTVVNYVKDESTNPSKPTKPSSSGSSSSSAVNPIQDTNLLVATFPKAAEVTLYDNNETKIGNRALASGTSWKVDKTKNYGGVKYYRVATNEWVKADNVYVYEDQSLIVRTGKSIQYLTNSQGKTVNNRALAPNTDWKIDRFAYINGSTYYRVATDEFVPTNDVVVK